MTTDFKYGLIGLRKLDIVGAAVTMIGEDEEGFTYIVVRKDGGKEISIFFSSDEEQNSPGCAVAVQED